jgi:hypothetical protein
MLGASLNVFREAALRTELDPRSGPGPSAAVEILPSVQIGLGYVDARSCRIYLMGRPLASDSFALLRQTLTERIAQGADPLAPVVLTAEAPVPWELVVNAMDAALAAGFENVQFAVNLGQ